METVTKRNRFDGNSCFACLSLCFHAGRSLAALTLAVMLSLSPLSRVCGAVLSKNFEVNQFREVTKLIELVTFCLRLG